VGGGGEGNPTTEKAESLPEVQRAGSKAVRAKKTEKKSRKKRGKITHSNEIGRRKKPPSRERNGAPGVGKRVSEQRDANPAITPERWRDLEENTGGGNILLQQQRTSSG